MALFQAKGVHDHLRPEAKSTAEARRSLGTGRRVRGLAMFLNTKEASLSSKVSIITFTRRPLSKVNQFNSIRSVIIADDELIQLVHISMSRSISQIGINTDEI